MGKWQGKEKESFNNVDVYQYGPVKFIWLKGSSTERLAAYGELFEKGVISDHPVQFFADRVLMPLKDPRAQGIGRHVLNFWNSIGLRKVPYELKKDMEELYRAFGKATVQRGTVLPDLASQLHAHQAFPMGRKYVPEMGCTSLVKVDGDRFLYGRNLDFDGVGVLDAYPNVVVHVPDSKEDLKYVSFTADSMPLAGISGINEAGISMALHKNYADVHSLGVPVLCIGELVLRRARTLDQAVSLLDSLRPGPAWTFVLTDMKNKKACTVETSAKFFSVREMNEDHFVQANHFMNEETKKHELSYQSTYQNSLIRHEYAKRELAKVQSMNDILNILGQQENRKGEISAFYDISKPATVHTFGFECDSKSTSCYFSGEEAPSTSGSFVKFELEDLWRGCEGFEVEQYTPYVSDECRKRQVASAEAFAQFFDYKDHRKTLELLEGHESDGAVVVRAICHYELAEYRKCLSVITQNEKTVAPIFWENLKVVQLMAMLKSRKSVDARLMAQELLRSGVKMPKLRSVAQTVAKSGVIRTEDEHLNFDFASGQILSKPQRIDDLVRDAEDMKVMEIVDGLESVCLPEEEKAAA